MTAPQEPASAPAGVQLMVGHQVIPGPNGAPIVVLIFGLGPTGYQIQVEWERSPGLLELITKNMDAGYEEAKRLASGLFVAGQDQMPQLPPINGVGFTGPPPGHPG